MIVVKVVVICRGDELLARLGGAGCPGGELMSEDRILAFLQQTRADAAGEPPSRALSLVVTKIEEAILWRQEDLRLKTPAGDDSSLPHAIRDGVEAVTGEGS